MLPCPTKVDCPDEFLTNYSSEDLDLTEFIGIAYGADGCVGRCTSLISQTDADLCAQRQAVLCSLPPGTVTFPNDPQECTVTTCGLGASFTFVVAAGQFIATTLDQANAQALSYACSQANLQRVCLGNILRCCCTGQSFDQTIGVDGASPSDLLFSVDSGALPTGLSLSDNNLSGTPTVPGTYDFTIRGTDANGNHADGTYQLSVLNVVDSALPGFQIGVPYSHQMTAEGGSGHYAWKIDTGVLPDGITMTLGGLISGTPTAGTSTTLVFDVIDTECATADKSFFPPRVSLSTLSTTRIATVRGYPEFPGFASLPPKKYHRLTWTGASEQWGNAITNAAEEVGRARYEWSGTGEIDSAGQQISNYIKNLFAACPSVSQYPIFLANGNGNINVGVGAFVGYCWDADPNSCEFCDSPPALVGSVSSNSVMDWAENFLRGNLATMADATHFNVHRRGIQPTTQWHGPWDGLVNYIVGDTVSSESLYYRAESNNTGLTPKENPLDWTLLAGDQFPGTVNPVLNFPPNNINGLPNWIHLQASHYYEGLLEDEYTDAEALANAFVYNSTGDTAENSPRTTGFVSRFTGVSFQLHFSNLVLGSVYVASVRFYNTRTGASTFQTFSFVASDVTHTINGTVPNPAVGQPLQVKNPAVKFF